MDDNDALDQTLSDLIGSSAPTIPDEASALGQIVHRARARVMRRRLVASAVTMVLVAAVAVAVVATGQRPDQVRVRGHSDPPITTAPESTTTGAPSTTTSSSPPPSTPPPVDRSLDLMRGTAFGIEPGNGVTPEAVLDKLTPVLGTPTRDTGWYITELRGDGDCFGNTRQRLLRWGNLSFAFWNPHDSPTEFTLWGWALGPYANLREPQPIVDTTPIGATTADGVGIGASIAELRARYGARVQVAVAHKTVFMSTSSNGVVFFSLENGKVSTIVSRLSFC